MQCPFCSNTETRVTDKRDVAKHTRRRRECQKCSRRFSTHERVEIAELKVIKKDGRRETFDRDKIKRGVMRSCEKRPVDDESVEKMIDRIENRLRRREKIINTEFIGGLVSRELKKLDKVAYIRFASIYQDFTELSDFKKEIRDLLKK